jgi:hypothetical protein
MEIFGHKLEKSPPSNLESNLFTFGHKMHDDII